jgi:hypothetical protein
MKALIKSIFLLIGVTALSCSSETMNTTFKQNAGGAVGEVILVIDDGLWEGPVGEELKETFKASFPGLYRDEPLFMVRQVNPEKLTSTLRNVRNIIYVNTLEDRSEGSRIVRSNYSSETIEMIKNDPSLFMQTSKDDHAIGQETLHLFGRNTEEIVKNISENRNKLRDFFNVTERKYITNKMVLTKESAAIKESMLANLGMSLNLPIGYKVVRQTEDFVWFRDFDGKVDRNIYMHIKLYSSQADFSEENVILWRDEIGKKHIYGDPNNQNSFMMTEMRIPIAQRNLNFLNSKYSIESRGQWRTNNKSMGGSFLSYVFNDNENKRIIYLEGFIYHPNEQHSDILREIEAVLWTFRESKSATQS